MSICASLDSAVTARGRAGLAGCGVHNKTISDVLSKKRCCIPSSMKQYIQIKRLFQQTIIKYKLRHIYNCILLMKILKVVAIFSIFSFKMF